MNSRGTVSHVRWPSLTEMVYQFLYTFQCMCYVTERNDVPVPPSSLGLGLGIGLGISVPIILGMAFGLFYQRRKLVFLNTLNTGTPDFTTKHHTVICSENWMTFGMTDMHICCYMPQLGNIYLFI